MQFNYEPRVKKRLSCSLNQDSRHHRGMILNLSQRGMFIQTTQPAEPGTLVDVDFSDPSHGDSIAVQAAVVWRRRVSPRMTGINQSGMGMRILMNTPEYESLMTGMLGASESVATATPGAERTIDESPQKDEPRADLHRYVVRLAQEGGPRSRRAVVHSASEKGARATALEQVGAGWTILEVVKR
jgi:hypothetical protein